MLVVKNKGTTEHTLTLFLAEIRMRPATPQGKIQIRAGFSTAPVETDQLLIYSETERHLVQGIIFFAIIDCLKKQALTLSALAELLRDTFTLTQTYYAVQLLWKLRIISDSSHKETDPFWSALERHAETPSHAPVPFLSSTSSTDRNWGRHYEILTVESYLTDGVEGEINRCLESSRYVVLTKMYGQVLWFGPLLSRETLCTWYGMKKRLKERLAASASYLTALDVLVSSAQFQNSAAVRLSEGILEFILDGLSHNCFTELSNSILTLDLRDLSMSWHSYRPANLPNNAASSERMGHGGNAWRIHLSATNRRFDADGGFRALTPDESFEATKHLIDPLLGIVGNMVKVPDPSAHVYNADQLLPIGRSLNSMRVGGRMAGAAGKGATDMQAKVSCLGEAVERYSLGFHGDEVTIVGTYEGRIEDAVHPNDILLYSETQYDNDAYKDRDDICWTPSRFDEVSKISWTKAWSLTDNRPRLIPTAMCFFNFDEGDSSSAFCRADSNGCASGNTLTEAVLQALLELVERDACAIWWYNRDRVSEIPFELFNDPFIVSMRHTHRNSERNIFLLDLSSDLSIPVVAAVSTEGADQGRINLGLGAHLNLEVAASRALAELNQILSIAPRDLDRNIDNSWYKWLRSATLDSERYLVPAAREFIPIRTEISPDLAENVYFIVDKLQGRKIETIVLDATRPDVGVPVARVFAPGLRHFWPRFAPGRLYTVPVALGRRTAPSPEETLNPTPFFL